MNPLKLFSTVATVVTAAELGKKAYDYYKDKKKEKDIKRVNETLNSIDKERLKNAIKNGDSEVLKEETEKILSVIDNTANDIFSIGKEIVEDVVKEVKGKLNKEFDNNMQVPSIEEWFNGKALVINNEIFLAKDFEYKILDAGIFYNCNGKKEILLYPSYNVHLINKEDIINIDNEIKRIVYKCKIDNEIKYVDEENSDYNINRGFIIDNELRDLIILDEEYKIIDLRDYN